ncbi:MAG: hypothetical protein ACREPA_12075 [Candidatus Dormibacteraceae bacterium]
MIAERDAVTLESIRPEDESIILPDFPALVDGREVWVTAVLDRTAVVEPAPGEPKIVVNRRRCLVDPANLRYRPAANRHAARRGREAARRNRLQTESESAA